MKRLRCSLVLAILSLLLAACARKASPPLPGDSVSEDGAVTLSPPRLSSTAAPAAAAEGPIEARLFPPELVMERQLELGVTEEQKSALISESERGHAEVLKQQWELEAEKEKLVKLLEPDRVDEGKVKDAAARVMDRETKVKAAYLMMLVRVKNVLTAEQKAKLRELRASPRVDGGTPSRADAGR